MFQIISFEKFSKQSWKDLRWSQNERNRLVFKLQPLQTATSLEESEEKILPSSQPLLPIEEDNHQANTTSNENEINVVFPLSSGETTSPTSSSENDNSRAQAMPAELPFQELRGEIIDNIPSEIQPTVVMQTADSTSSLTEDVNCPICRVDVTQDVDGILCEMCHTWSHRTCLFMSEETFNNLYNSTESW